MVSSEEEDSLVCSSDALLVFVTKVDELSFVVVGSSVGASEVVSLADCELVAV